MAPQGLSSPGKASCGRGVCSYLSLALLDLSILGKFSNGGGGAASSVWLPRAFPVLWRPAVQEGGVASLALLLRSCLYLHEPAAEERDTFFLAWYPRECLVLGKTVMEKRGGQLWKMGEQLSHSGSGRSVQAWEDQLWRKRHSFPGLACPGEVSC